MKIVYAITIGNNEITTIVEKNIKILKNIKNIDLTVIINSIHKYNFEEYIWINKVSDMKDSREAIIEESSKINADAYLIFDPDIVLGNNFKFTLKKIVSYQKKYDFISLYYKGDPPIPAFFTLASSLNDFYNEKTNYVKRNIDVPFFDDTMLNSSEYMKFNPHKSKKDFSEILFGRSYARDIDNFTVIDNEKDTTTGGAMIYFNKETLTKKYNWQKHNNKSLTWYDSYRTYMLSKKYSYCKVPIFLEHKRSIKSISLNYYSVKKYCLGLNLYMTLSNNKDWNYEGFILHTIGLFMYIQGMVKKIEALSLCNNDKQTIKVIKKFMTDNHDFIKKQRRLLWK